MINKLKDIKGVDMVLTAYRIGDIHILNNGMVCIMSNLDNDTCPLCCFRKYNENTDSPSCIKSSYMDLRMIEFYPELHYCYAYLRRDRYAITKILGKVGLFTICLVKKLSYEI